MPVFKLAKALIDKPAWYQHFKLSTIRLKTKDKSHKLKQLDALKSKGLQLKPVTAVIPYLPLTALFDPKGQANMALFRQIPHGAIIEIIRPNWDLRPEIGTCLNVSHLGFAFWKRGILIFRNASSLSHRVDETPLIEYLYNARVSPTIKGINVQVLRPKAPLLQHCLGFSDNQT